MKIDFTKVLYYSTYEDLEIGSYRVTDCSKFFGNWMSFHSRKFEYDELGRRIYLSKGPVEIGQDEIDMLLRAIEESPLSVTIKRSLMNTIERER